MLRVTTNILALFYPAARECLASAFLSIEVEAIDITQELGVWAQEFSAQVFFSINRVATNIKVLSIPKGLAAHWESAHLWICKEMISTELMGSRQASTVFQPFHLQ